MAPTLFLGPFDHSFDQTAFEVYYEEARHLGTLGKVGDQAQGLRHRLSTIASYESSSANKFPH